MDSMISVRVNKTQKEQAQKILRRLGLDLSTAINIYINQIILKGGIPFMIEEPNEHLYQALEEARSGKGLSKPFNSVEEMISDIMDGEDKR